ncbi:MAG: hypothetical protein FWG68_04745 [Defluviitaleaceae bacterium]|nr:hypothetical protein [Defluviitaleaceae bacterium]
MTKINTSIFAPNRTPKQAFWDGFFYNAPFEFEFETELKTPKYGDFSDDGEAIRAVWQDVGDCLRFAMGEFEKELANGKKTS